MGKYISIDVPQDKPLQEKCGIVAIYNREYSSNVPYLIHAANGVQHRGLHGAGIALKTKKKVIVLKGPGLIKDVFSTKVIDKLSKQIKWGIVHCRYGTFGGYDPHNLQPCIVKSPQGEEISVAHNGEFIITNVLRKKLLGLSTADASDTYMFASLLANSQGKTWDEKVLKTLSQVNGAFCLAIGTPDGLYIARDQFGLRPFILGMTPEGWMFASETHAFDKVGAEVIREIKKGEIVKIDDKGLHILKEGNDRPQHFCDFEWCYFARPNSMFPIPSPDNEEKRQKWLSLYQFRVNCGEAVATESPLKKASFIVGLPDSGLPIAEGYANALGIPRRQLILRDHFDPHGNGRLFMKDEDKTKIGKKVLGKLSIIAEKDIWKDAIVVLCDDSIVRGNVSAQITKAIFDLGAKEVHWVIGFPPVIGRCHLGVSIRTEGELIATRHKGNPEKIAKEIGATSIRYISFKGFIQSRLLSNPLVIPKNPKEVFIQNGGCGGCVTGIYPINEQGVIHKHHLTG